VAEEKEEARLRPTVRGANAYALPKIYSDIRQRQRQRQTETATETETPAGGEGDSHELSGDFLAETLESQRNSDVAQSCHTVHYLMSHSVVSNFTQSCHAVCYLILESQRNSDVKQSCPTVYIELYTVCHTVHYLILESQRNSDVKRYCYQCMCVCI